MMRSFLNAAKDYGWIILGLCLLVAVTFLPPDTSLQQLKQHGVLTACVPPLVTSQQQQPGEPPPSTPPSTLERQLLLSIAEQMGLRLSLNEVVAMTQNFDPRDWGINRAQCAIMAAGIADTRLTRGFLDVSIPYGEAGLVALSAQPHDSVAGLQIAIPANIQGIDRLALSQFLRKEQARARLTDTAASALALLQQNAVDAVIIAAADAHQESSLGKSWTEFSLPQPFDSHPMVLGLWKGDLTLKRAVNDALVKLRDNGTLDAINAAYAGQ